jgi:hypothetical protein
VDLGIFSSRNRLGLRDLAIALLIRIHRFVSTALSLNVGIQRFQAHISLLYPSENGLPALKAPNEFKPSRAFSIRCYRHEIKSFPKEAIYRNLNI